MLLKHKERATVRGELMKLDIHYDPSHISALMADIYLPPWQKGRLSAK